MRELFSQICAVASSRELAEELVYQHEALVVADFDAGDLSAFAQQRLESYRLPRLDLCPEDLQGLETALARDESVRRLFVDIVQGDGPPEMTFWATFIRWLFAIGRGADEQRERAAMDIFGISPRLVDAGGPPDVMKLYLLAYILRRDPCLEGDFLQSLL